jgi:hypothetical protein
MQVSQYLSITVTPTELNIANWLASFWHDEQYFLPGVESLVPGLTFSSGLIGRRP